MHKRKYNLDPNRFWRLNNWKMWALLITGLFLFFPIFRFVRSQLQKNEEQQANLDVQQNFVENQNPNVVQSKADKITTRKDIQQAAKEIAHHLGTKYSDQNVWYDFIFPSGWTENDKRVADILIYQRNNYSYLKKLYYACYSNSRDLSADLIKLLDDDQMKRVQKVMKI